MLNKTIHNSFSNYESLDEYLLSIGVPPSKIAISKIDKVKKLGRNDGVDLCYDFIREEKEDIKVPIKYIYDVARDGVTRHNMSWYDHMNFALFGGNSQFKNGLIQKKLLNKKEAVILKYNASFYQFSFTCPVQYSLQLQGTSIVFC